MTMFRLLLLLIVTVHPQPQYGQGTIPVGAVKRLWQEFVDEHKVFLKSVLFDFLVLVIFILALTSARFVFKLSETWIAPGLTDVLERLHGAAYAAGYLLFLLAFLKKLFISLFMERHRP